MLRKTALALCTLSLALGAAAFGQCTTEQGAFTDTGPSTETCGVQAINSPVTVTGSGSPILGGVYQYTASVSGGASTAVVWDVNGTVGGSAALGTISTAGLYTAPTQMPSSSGVTITATSSANPSYAGSVVGTLQHGVPPQAVSSGLLDKSTNWQFNHDPGTNGTSTGTTTYPVTFAGYTSREYDVSWTDYGGEIYHLSFAKDTSAHHFIYDTYVYLVNPSEVNPLEMDMNQVLANGNTVIYGVQCNGSRNSGAGSWDITQENPAGGHGWVGTSQPCHPTTQFAVGWHHVQIATERDDSGNATYDWVMVDGTYQDINTTLVDNDALGWTVGTLLINFQIDGPNSGSGSSTTYTHDFQVWRW